MLREFLHRLLEWMAAIPCWSLSEERRLIARPFKFEPKPTGATVRQLGVQEILNKSEAITYQTRCR
jgi:hypothetical protein